MSDPREEHDGLGPARTYQRKMDRGPDGTNPPYTRPWKEVDRDGGLGLGILLMVGFVVLTVAAVLFVR